MPFETENTEFKVQFTQEIYKEVIAFANTDGGTIYVGVDDNGQKVGLSDVDDTFTRITNGIRDAIAPDVTMHIRYTSEEGGIIRITVNRGTNRPYYLQSKGLKPSGVYVRQGASGVPASSEQIRQMIKESDGDNFEECRSLEQDLTFEAAEKAFREYKVEFGKEKYLALGLTLRNDPVFTNLALLLSDQCAHTTKIAVFQDAENTLFKDSQEFGGSVFRQLEDAFRYLMLCNHTPAVIKGLVRIETPDYPEAAIREALLNALVHRDYGFSGSIIINVNSAQMEFVSIGGLLSGLSAEDIRAGISQPRNRKLAEIFHRLHLIESYGTGIRRIYHLYADCKAQPRIEVTPNTFKMILPNMNADHAEEGKAAEEISPQMQRILHFVAENGSANDAALEELLQVGRTRVYTLVHEMRTRGLLRQEGKGQSKKYFLP